MKARVAKKVFRNTVFAMNWRTGRYFGDSGAYKFGTVERAIAIMTGRRVRLQGQR